MRKGYKPATSPCSYLLAGRAPLETLVRRYLGLHSCSIRCAMMILVVQRHSRPAVHMQFFSQADQPLSSQAVSKNITWQAFPKIVRLPPCPLPSIAATVTVTSLSRQLTG